MIGEYLEIYIDDIEIKFENVELYLQYLTSQGVKAENFLGFLVREKGIKIDVNKAKAIIQAQLPINKKELQKFLGHVNFLKRFIYNLVGKKGPFTKLLCLKKEDEEYK